jgi:hypothetical protein
MEWKKERISNDAFHSKYAVSDRRKLPAKIISDGRASV